MIRILYKDSLFLLVGIGWQKSLLQRILPEHFQGTILSVNPALFAGIFATGSWIGL